MGGGGKGREGEGASGSSARSRPSSVTTMTDVSREVAREDEGGRRAGEDDDSPQNR